jgi:hypothetical protein
MIFPSDDGYAEDAEVREALRILRTLSRIRGHTLLTAREWDALRRGRLLLKKINKRHDKDRTDTQGGARHPESS